MRVKLYMLAGLSAYVSVLSLLLAVLWVIVWLGTGSKQASWLLTGVAFLGFVAATLVMAAVAWNSPAG